MTKNFKDMVAKAAWEPETITPEERTDYKEVVINACYGGYSLSKDAYRYLGMEWDNYGFNSPDRDDAKLINCVKSLGKRASGSCAELTIETIPSCYDYTVEEYDGFESIRLLPKKAVIRDLANDVESLIGYLDAIDSFRE